MQWMKILRRIFLWLILFWIFVIFIFYIFIYMISSGVDDDEIYTENDFLKYYTLTDPDILNSPKVSGKYYFEYHPGDGYPLSNSIVFSGGADVEPLKRYLSDLGYTLHKRIINKNEIVWESRCSINQPASFYLSVNYTENSVQLEKEICY